EAWRERPEVAAGGRGGQRARIADRPLDEPLAGAARCSRAAAADRVLLRRAAALGAAGVARLPPARGAAAWLLGRVPACLALRAVRAGSPVPAARSLRAVPRVEHGHRAPARAARPEAGRRAARRAPRQL